MTSLVVNEIYGPVFQGEGPDLGKPCHFLRLWGCSVQCHWCDTSYTWDTSVFRPEDEAKSMSVDEVRKQVLELVSDSGIRRLVISGGEPMQQASSLFEFLDDIPAVQDVEIETSGIISPWPTLPRNVRVYFNVSPKLRHAETKRQYSWATLLEYRNRGARFKFVVRNEADLDEVAEIQRMVGIRNDLIWIMPLGITKDDVNATLRSIANSVVQRRWNVTTRLHVLLYGSRRGV